MFAAGMQIGKQFVKLSIKLCWRWRNYWRCWSERKLLV